MSNIKSQSKIAPTNKFQFAQDVDAGLNAVPKYLSSKYFYDEKGDILFQQIMDLDEYYLTRSEYENFNTYKEDWFRLFSKDVESFNLIEFGAGDAYKTKVLLKYFLEHDFDFTYVPIDISGNVLEFLADRLNDEIPNLKVKPIQSDYFKAFDNIKPNDKSRNIILFLGSNIGNFTPSVAIDFYSKLKSKCGKNDFVLTGIDIKKDPGKILMAYNDSKGVTESFNKNVLSRINRELGANFEPDNFIFFPTYNPQNGEVRSYLLAKHAHQVFIKSLNKSYTFDAFEPIFTEISKKYDADEISNLANDTGFELIKNYYDSKKHFVNTLWGPKT